MRFTGAEVWGDRRGGAAALALLACWAEAQLLHNLILVAVGGAWGIWGCVARIAARAAERLRKPAM